MHVFFYWSNRANKIKLFSDQLVCSGLGLVQDLQLFLCDLVDTVDKTLHQVKCHQSTLQHLRHIRIVSLLLQRPKSKR